MCLWIILEAEFSLKLAFRLELTNKKDRFNFYKERDFFVSFSWQALVATGKGRDNEDVAML